VLGWGGGGGGPPADDTAQHALDAVATDAALALGKRAGAVRTAAHRGLRTLAQHPALTGERRTRGIRSPAR
jgi:hypothetical protein